MFSDITVNRYSFAAGILLGLFIGILIGSKFQTPPICLKLMKSVVCSGYNGVDVSYLKIRHRKPMPSKPLLDIEYRSLFTV